MPETIIRKPACPVYTEVTTEVSVRKMACPEQRRRGGQPGNNNARKHGFYSAAMGLPEISAYYSMLSLGVDREIAMLRLKMNAALYSASSNPRVLADATRLLVRWCRSRYDVSAEDNPELKKIIRDVLKESNDLFLQNELKLNRQNSPENYKTNMPQNEANLTYNNKRLIEAI